MVSKATGLKGAFGGVVMYATQEHKHAQVIKAEGVRMGNPLHTIEDFKIQASLNPRIEKNCLHIILSHHPQDGEKIRGKDREILNEYLKRLKTRGIDFDQTQYIIYKHNDKGHEHYHLVANMVDNKGKRFNDSHIGYKMKYTSKEITQAFKLTPAVKMELQKLVQDQNYAIGRAIELMKNPSLGKSIMDAAEILHNPIKGISQQIVKGIADAINPEEDDYSRGMSRGRGGMSR